MNFFYCEKPSFSGDTGGVTDLAQCEFPGSTFSQTQHNLNPHEATGLYFSHLSGSLSEVHMWPVACAGFRMALEHQK